MQRIINRILILIIVILLGLLIYKAMRPINSVSTSLATTTVQKNVENEFSQEKIELVIKEYLMNNPEVIVDAIEQLQKRKNQEMELKVKGFINDKKDEIENSSSSPIIGNIQGDITIVTFYDYNCSYCKKANKYLNELLESDANVKVILKPFPILGESSIYAAKIALAVNAIDPLKFKKVHEGLMNMSPVSKEAIESLVTAESMDFAKVSAEAEKIEIRNIITKNFDLAGNLRIQGAPAYIINSRLMPGMLDVSTLKQVIADIRSEQKKD